MKFIQVRDRAKEMVDRLTARLLRDFPEQQGKHAVVFGQAPEVDMGSRHYQYPPPDNRPEWLKAEVDSENWKPIKR